MKKVKVESVITGFVWKMFGLELPLIAVLILSIMMDISVLPMILLFAVFMPVVLIVALGRRGINLYFKRTVRYDENEVNWWGFCRHNRVRMEKVTQFRCEMIYFTENLDRSLDGSASAMELSFEQTGLFGIRRRKHINDVLNVSQLDIKHGDYKGSIPLADVYRFLEEKYPEKAGGMLSMR